MNKTLLPLILVANMLWGITINVPGDYATIQSGIDAASDGDTVLVWPGVYDVTQLLFISNITLTSRFIYDNNQSMIDSTIINGLRGGYLIDLSGDNTNIIGLTINNSMGNGIYITDSPNIINCILDKFNLTYPMTAISVQSA